MSNAALLAEPVQTGPVLLDAMAALNRRADDVIQRLRATVFAPGEEKIVDLRFTITRAAEMVGRTVRGHPPGRGRRATAGALARAARADGRVTASPRSTICAMCSAPGPVVGQAIRRSS